MDCLAVTLLLCFFFFFSSRRRHTRFDCDWSSDVCSSDLRAPRRADWLHATPHRALRRVDDLDVEADRVPIPVVRSRDHGPRAGLGGEGSNVRSVDMAGGGARHDLDRKSTRLNSSHSQISYAVFCLKKKKM